MSNLYHCIIIWCYHCTIALPQYFLKGIFEQFIFFRLHSVFYQFYHFESVLHYQVKRPIGICGRVFFVVLRFISGLYPLMWKLLTTLSNSSCGQFLQSFSFCESIWSLFVLWLTLLYIITICCINIDILGPEFKKIMNVNIAGVNWANVTAVQTIAIGWANVILKIETSKASHFR